MGHRIVQALGLMVLIGCWACNRQEPVKETVSWTTVRHLAGSPSEKAKAISFEVQKAPARLKFELTDPAMTADAEVHQVAADFTRSYKLSPSDPTTMIVPIGSSGEYRVRVYSESGWTAELQTGS